MKNALKIESVDDPACNQTFLVRRNGRDTDTARRLTLPLITVAAGARYRLTITAAHTLDLTMARGHNESFLKQVRWLDPAATLPEHARVIMVAAE